MWSLSQHFVNKISPRLWGSLPDKQRAATQVPYGRRLHPDIGSLLGRGIPVRLILVRITLLGSKKSFVHFTGIKEESSFVQRVSCLVLGCTRDSFLTVWSLFSKKYTGSQTSIDSTSLPLDL